MSRRARVTHVRRNFWRYLRGVLKGHPGVRIGRGARLGGPGSYQLERGSTIGADVRVWVGEGATLTLRRGSKIGDRSIVNVATSVHLGEGAEVSWNTQLLDTDFHWIQDAAGEVRSVSAPIVVEDDVLVGTGALILKSVTIGRGAIVAAGAVVTKSVPPRAIVAGNPARVVGEAAAWGTGTTDGASSAG